MDTPTTPARVFSHAFPSPKLIFLFGAPHTGKRYQALRFSEEMDFLHLDMESLMSEEISKGSASGQVLDQALKADLQPPKEERVKLLTKAFLENPAPAYIITGFLETLDEALEFEHKAAEMKVILHYVVRNKELFLKRFKADQMQVGSDLASFENTSHPVIEYYRQFSIIQEVDASGTPDQVALRTKQAIRPEVFFVIGPKGVGKTALAIPMQAKYNMTYVNMADVARFKDPAGRWVQVQDDSELVARLTRTLEKQNSLRFVVEGFPYNANQLRQFEIAYTRPKGLFYLGVHKEELVLRTRDVEAPKSYATFIKETAPLLAVAKEKPYFSVINANGSLANSLSQVAQIVEPETIMIRGDEEEAFRKFLESQGYTYLDIHQAMNAVCHRLTPKGKEVIKHIECGKVPPSQLLVRILHDFLYSGRTFDSKFLLGGKFPAKVRQLNYIEQHCMGISQMYYVTQESLALPIEYCEKETLETAFYRSNRFSRIVYNSDSDFEELMKHTARRAQDGQYVIVCGSMLSGRSTVAGYLQKHGYRAINYEELPESIKTQKSTEDEPYENVTWEDIIEELTRQVKTDKIVLDGFPPASMVVGEEEEQQGEEEEEGEETQPVKKNDYHQKIMHELLPALGEPYCVLVTSSEMPVLEKRLFVKLELGEDDELNEEHKEPLVKSFNDLTELAPFFKSVRVPPPEGMSTLKWKTQIFHEIDTSYNLSGVYAHLDGIFGVKVLLMHGISSKEEVTFIDNLCLNYDLLHVNVPKLIKEQIGEQTERGQLIEALLGQKLEVPLNVTLEVVNDYIRKHLTYRSFLVVLSGLLKPKSLPEYPRHMDGLISVQENVGEIIGLISLANRLTQADMKNDDIPVVHYPPPKNPDDEEEEKQDEEEDEDGENKKQKEEEEELPPRSDPRPAIHLHKAFQLYKRDKPEFKELEDLMSMEEALTEALTYVVEDRHMSRNTEERLRCANIQIMQTY